MAALMLAAFLAARLPRGISPRLPWWLGAVLCGRARSRPRLGRRPQMSTWVRSRWAWEVWATSHCFSMVAIDVLAAAPARLDDAPGRAVARSREAARPALRHLRVPVDELVGAIALSIRCLPLLLEEARVPRAARSARRPVNPRSFKELGEEAVESGLRGPRQRHRRAREIAEAIEARGGVPTVAPETHPFVGVDVLALVAVPWRSPRWPSSAEGIRTAPRAPASGARPRPGRPHQFRLVAGPPFEGEWRTTREPGRRLLS